MKRCLYVLTVLTMIWSLAACGKAVSSPRALSETEEIHLGYVDENSEIEIVDTEKITVRPDKINVGFAQSSNLLEWQVAQTESFYAAFMESDGYHLNIVVRAESAGIRVILLEAEEAKTLGGDEARRQLERETLTYRDTLTYETDKKR